MNKELLAFGERLRASREALDLTLKEVEVETRIRIKFLHSFEDGEPDPSLSYTQIRGFLRNYARLLRLDPDEILAQYEAARSSRPKKWGLFPKRTPQPSKTSLVPQAPSPENTATPPIPAPAQEPPVPRKAAWRQVLRLVILVAAGLLFLVMIGGGVLILLPALNGEPSGESVLNPPLATSASSDQNDSSSGTPSATPQTPTTQPTQGGIILDSPVVQLDGLVMFINVITRSWVEIAVDGETKHRGMLQAGTGLQYQAEDSISLTTANAGGLEITLNNQPLGPLGEQGAYFQQTFTKAGLPTATFLPTLPPTPMPTTTITNLPPSSSTPTFTSTASPVPGESAATLPIPNQSGIAATEVPVLLPSPQATLAPINTIVTPTLFIPSSTPTFTATSAPTATATVVLPDRITRTPHP